MSDSKLAFVQQQFKSHPFGLSDVGLLCESLNLIFKNRLNSLIGPWLIRNQSSIRKLPLEVPMLPLLLCAAYAMEGHREISAELIQHCLATDSVWTNLADGDDKYQRIARLQAIKHINFYQGQPEENIVDLLAHAVLKGNDTHSMKDFRNKVKELHLYELGYDVAKKAVEKFPQDPSVASELLKLCPNNEKEQWRALFNRRFPGNKYLTQRRQPT